MESFPKEAEISITSRILEQIDIVQSRNNVPEHFQEQLQEFRSEKNIPFRIVKEIHDILSASGDKNVLYLHELIEGCELSLPEPPVIPRNEELEARCQRLQAQQDNQRYKKMVKNVDKSMDRDYFSESVGKDVKEMNRQLVSVFNFVITVGAAFAFGYKATEYTFGQTPNTFAFQMIAALTLATIVFFADLYFLLRESS